MHMPPLFLRRRLRKGRLERDVASLDGLGVGPGDLPRRRRVRPRAGRGIGPEVVVGRQADGLRRPAARRVAHRGASRQTEAPQDRGRRPEEVQARPRPRARRRWRVPLRRRPREAVPRRLPQARGMALAARKMPKAQNCAKIAIAGFSGTSARPGKKRAYCLTSIRKRRDWLT